VQRLARIGAGGEDRVVAEQPGVAVGGALLEDLADEAVDVDHQPPAAGPRAGPPRPLDRPPQQRVELAHVPEGERAQERAERRRGGDPATQQPPGAPGPQHVGVVDAVGAQHHRIQQRHDLAPRVGGAGTVAAQPHELHGQRLDPQAAGERRDPA
jgi:hypothetical protein